MIRSGCNIVLLWESVDVGVVVLGLVWRKKLGSLLDESIRWQFSRGLFDVGVLVGNLVGVLLLELWWGIYLLELCESRWLCSGWRAGLELLL